MSRTIPRKKAEDAADQRQRDLITLRLGLPYELFPRSYGRLRRSGGSIRQTECVDPQGMGDAAVVYFSSAGHWNDCQPDSPHYHESSGTRGR